DRRDPAAIAQGVSDEAGQFRIDAPRTSSARQSVIGAVSTAPGFGFGWSALDPDDEAPTADVTLRRERVIEGRLLDLQGQPASDVEVSVVAMIMPAARQRNAVQQAVRVFVMPPKRIKTFGAWPDPVKTDTQGRFTLRGIGQGLRLLLRIQDPRYAGEELAIQT